jgi:hypothetical protein
MSKPIFVVRLSNNRTEKEVNTIKESILKHPVAQDYHILVLRDEKNDGDAKFECYNSKCTEIEFQQLKDELYEMTNKKKKSIHEKMMSQKIGFDGC